ncbi:Protein WEAK CHLOROPLAST MOVEMENT UNDER BLUE LIGHT 1 [Capsicum chinense]|nr:Protein WEAK CHLOROPLAST MOVEMENT UNDER BLUE LIGHT 1 [Capsicum chinense]
MELKLKREADKEENSKVDLINSKEFLEAAHTAHLEDNEHLVEVAMAREQDTINWEKELKKAVKELERLNKKTLSAKDHKAKLDTTSSLLQNLNNELASYMESKLKQEADEEEHSKGKLLEPEK